MSNSDQIDGVDVTQNPRVTQAALDEHSEQALIELIYMKQANKVLDKNVSDLNDALQTITDALDTLNTIQSLHNQIMVGAKKSFEEDQNFSIFQQTSDYQGASQDYQDAASNYFGPGITPQLASFLDSNFPDLYGNNGTLDQLKTKLTGLIHDLSATTSDTSDPTTLYAKLKVLSDEFPTNQSTLSKWILDSYDVQNDSTSSDSGIYQQHITDAITAAQSLNNTQTELVRRTLFVVEEYYKSAGSLMAALNTIIQDMARNINK